MMSMMIMMMMKLTKRAKEMRKGKEYDVDGDDDSSDYDSGKCLTLRQKQPFAPKQCKSQRTFPTVTSISH